MATAVLLETLYSYTIQKNQLTLENTMLQSRKSLVAQEQGDVNLLFNAQKGEIRDNFKELYENDPALQAKYSDYTEIPEFEEEMDKIQAELDKKLDELTNWEVQIDAQITKNSVLLEEISAYEQSFKGMYTSNIQEEYSFKLS